MGGVMQNSRLRVASHEQQAQAQQGNGQNGTKAGFAHDLINHVTNVVDIPVIASGGAGNMIVCEIVRVHVNEAVLDDDQRIDPNKIDLVGRMGGNWYVRASGDAIFEVPKPLRTLGIGVDQLPEDVRTSNVLTGNDLGMLGNVEGLPNETDVNEYKLIELSDLFQEYDADMAGLERQLHLRAQELLAEGNVEDAWKTLLTFNN